LEIDLGFDRIDSRLSGEHRKSYQPASVDEVKDLDNVSPPYSIKEPNSSELWTDVVRKGRYKGKGRVRNDKLVNHESGILEC
jgi:hypothetical protein